MGRAERGHTAGLAWGAPCMSTCFACQGVVEPSLGKPGRIAAGAPLGRRAAGLFTSFLRNSWTDGLHLKALEKSLCGSVRQRAGDLGAFSFLLLFHLAWNAVSPFILSWVLLLFVGCCLSPSPSCFLT